VELVELRNVAVPFVVDLLLAALFLSFVGVLVAGFAQALLRL
jgi:hypothetical protein